MDRKKGQFPLPDPREPPPGSERRRMSKIVHDHKGTASVQWRDAPADYERPILEVEGARPVAGGTGGTGSFNTGALAIHTADDSHNPYTRIPDGDLKTGAGRPKDLRKLSAWIKLMRELEEAKRRNGGDEE
jgi:hypothetical protein